MTIEESLNLAAEHFKSGRVAEAEQICRQILAAIPDHPATLNLVGMMLGSGGQHEQAAAVFGRLARVQPHLPEAHANLGFAWQMCGRLDEAAAACRRALQLRPDFVDAQITLGNVLLAQSAARKDIALADEAIALFQKTRTLRPDLWVVHFNLANTLAGRGRIDEAVTAYRQAMTLRPGDAAIGNNLGLALHSAGRAGEAAEVFTQAIALAPNDWRLMNNLGTVLEEMGQWDKAAGCYSQVLALQPELPEAHKNLAHALHGGGRLDEALAAHGRVLSRWPADWEPYLNMCRIVREKGNGPSVVSLDFQQPALAKLPYLGDKVVLLRCDRAAREELRGAGLHGGYLMDPDSGADRWLAAQMTANHAPKTLESLLRRWLELLRDEAAMSGTTTTVWLPRMPQETAAAIGRIVGDDLISVAGGSAAEIHATMCARAIAPPQNADKIWAIVSVRNGGLELLPHWLEHYTRLGCDQLLVGVFDDVPQSDRDELERCARQWKFTTFSQHWGNEPDEWQYSQRRSACRRAGALASTWIVNTDLDEFHQYPAPLREILDAAGSMGMRAIHGHFVDRVAADGSFPLVRPAPSLWEQFPVECDITQRVCGAVTQKVMVSRYGMHVNPGHHDAANEPGQAPPVGTAAEYRVAHFKWHGKVTDRLRWAMQQPHAPQAWRREARRFLSWLDRNGGRIKLAELDGADEAYERAKQRLVAGDLEAARSLCREILNGNPGKANALNLMGMISYQMSQRDEAVDFFRQATEADPNGAEYQFNLARALHAMDRWAAAVQAYRAVVALRPTHSTAHKNMGMALHLMGQMGQAIEAYQRGLELEPTDHETLTNLAGALSDGGRHTEAIDCYRKALALQPENAAIYNSFGLALSLAGNPEEGVAAYRRAIAIKPDFLAAHRNLPWALNKAGRLSEAFAAYKRLLTITPEDLNSFWSMCRLWLPIETRTSSGGQAIPRSRVQKLPYVGDKVVLLRCNRIVREQLRAAGLHGGHLIDTDGGGDLWLTAQAGANHSQAVLERLLSCWLENLRNEAAMMGSTATLWLAEMPAAFVEVFRRLAGDDLVEVSGDRADQILTNLAAHAKAIPNTADKIWAIVSIRNGGLELLPHWLEHYTTLGCDQLLVGVFDDVPRLGLEELDRCRTLWNFKTFAQQWGSEGDEIQYSQRRTACRESGALPSTWIINTDLDEFHEYPAPLRELLGGLASDRRGMGGNFVDRVAANGTFPVVVAAPSIWGQFPVRCDITKRIGLGATRKIMASRYCVRVNPGHHDANELIPPPPVGGVMDYRVHHFKWHGGVIDRMRWSLSQPNAPLEWKLEARRFLDWLDRNGGRMNLNDPAIAAVTTP